jgi:hypothetical protein
MMPLNLSDLGAYPHHVLMGWHTDHPVLYDLTGWKLMPNLREISIERYLGQGLFTGEPASVRVERTEIFQDGTERSIRLRTVIVCCGGTGRRSGWGVFRSRSCTDWCCTN